MRVVGPTHYGDLRGPTACELITDAEAVAIHARLGEDPLRPDPDPDRAWARISRSRAPLATLLMDQKVIAGVGNVYRGPLPARARPAPAGRGLRRAVGRGVGRSRGAAARRGAPQRIGPCAPSAPRAVQVGLRPPVYVYRRTGGRACAAPIAHDTHLAATSSGARCASRGLTRLTRRGSAAVPRVRAPDGVCGLVVAPAPPPPPPQSPPPVATAPVAALRCPIAADAAPPVRRSARKPSAAGRRRTRRRRRPGHAGEQRAEQQRRPDAHAPPISADRHHGSGTSPAGTGRPRRSARVWCRCGPRAMH